MRVTVKYIMLYGHATFHKQTSFQFGGERMSSQERYDPCFVCLSGAKLLHFEKTHKKNNYYKQHIMNLLKEKCKMQPQYNF